MVDYFKGIYVSHASAGEKHTLVIADKKLYAFGNNDYHQISSESDPKMQRIKITGEIPSVVYASGHASYVLMESGKVYFFG